MQLQAFTFEGQALPMFQIKGKPAWLARDVGQALGYIDNGRRMVNNISEKWSAELIEGKDYAVLKGPVLKDFKDLVSLSTVSVPDREKACTETVYAFLNGASRVTVLYETGLNLVCLLSKKPLGRVLRRWLADEVLPMLARQQNAGALPTTDMVKMREIRATSSLLFRLGRRKEATRLALQVGRTLAPELFPNSEEPENFSIAPPMTTFHLLAKTGAGKGPMMVKEWVELVGKQILPKSKSRNPRSHAITLGKIMKRCLDTPFEYNGKRYILKKQNIFDSAKRERSAYAIGEHTEQLQLLN